MAKTSRKPIVNIGQDEAYLLKRAKDAFGRIDARKRRDGVRKRRDLADAITIGEALNGAWVAAQQRGERHKNWKPWIVAQMGQSYSEIGLYRQIANWPDRAEISDIGTIDGARQFMGAVRKAESEADDGEDDTQTKPEPVLRSGDVIILGRHRLFCGDSRAPSIHLTDFPTPRFIVCDPPYGINYPGVLNDDIADWRGVWRFFRRVEAAVTFYSPLRADDVLAGLKSVGFEPRDHLVWVKKTPSNPYKNSAVAHVHECAYISTPKGDPIAWAGEPLQSVLSGYSVSKKERRAAGGHRTVKPVALMRRIVECLTEPGDAVADPFGGSGPVLMACEESGRRCLAMEADLQWCEVVVRRWQVATGQQAMLAQFGEAPVAFDDLGDRKPEARGARVVRF